MSRTGSETYCATQVRTFDRDRYLTALFAPEARRDSLFALYAFNLEIAKTRETVSEPLLGQMRLQWWREAIDGIYAGAARQHEVVAALDKAVGAGGLSRALFDRMIDGREFDLTDDPPADVAALESYAADTSSALMALGIEVLGGATDEALEAARHGGIAWALAGLLRAVPFHASQRRVYLPLAGLTAAGLSAGDVCSPRPNPDLKKVVQDLVGRARQHLADARQRRNAVPVAARPALLPLVLADTDLTRIERADYDVFAIRDDRASTGRLLRLLSASVRKRF